MLRNLLRGVSPPSQTPDRTGLHQPYSIAIDLDALMDSMTLLRGMTAHGNMFPGFTSDEITRFPSFELNGTHEWRLPKPHSVNDLLDRAIHHKGFFNRVRPYDFAERDVTFLRRKNVEIVVHVPELWKPHAAEIGHWINKYFPPSVHEADVTVDTSWENEKVTVPDVWVVRSPTLAQHLARLHQPFILFDGIENARIHSGVRAIRWDQVGYALRQGEHIFSRDLPSLHDGPNTPIPPIKIAPTKDIWHGRTFIAADQTQAALWVGQQREFLERVLADPDARLRWMPTGGKAEGKPLSDDQKKNALAAVRTDLRELDRKGKLIESLAAENLHRALSSPRWLRTIHERELEMRRALEDLENELRIDPITGTNIKRRPSARNGAPTAQLTERVEVGSDKGEIQLQLRVSDYIHLITKNWDRLQKENMPEADSHRAGVMAEVITVLMLQQEGWKVYAPRSRTTRQGKVDSLQDYTRIEVQWHGHGDPQRLRKAEVDCLALGPDGKLYVIEVKVSASLGLSALQNELKNHLANNGAILNPDVRGLDDRIHLLHPRHRILVFDRENIMKAARTNSASTRSLH